MDRKELKECLKNRIDLQADALFDYYEEPYVINVDRERENA